MNLLQQKFLNKKVKVINVNSPFDKNATFVGICTRIGFNQLLGNKKYVTIDRTPLFINSFNQISLYD